MRWLRRISGIVWIFSWYTIYLEIFRWHHMPAMQSMSRSDFSPQFRY